MHARYAIVFVLGFTASFVHAQSPTAAEKQATIAYLHSLQKPNGGFAPDAKADSPATLGATSAALRALKYFGGELKNREACGKFVQSCFDVKSGGHTPTPGGKPDVRTTAVGIMALVELDLPRGGEYPALVADYFVKNAKTFEDIRIAAAGLEAIKPRANVPIKEWQAEIGKNRNADGSYGKGANVARDTGGSVVAVLRLGGKVEQPESVVAALRKGQLADGGFGKEGQTGSDLETTYRVVRAFMMLKEKPDVAACRRFIAKCRNADGSYSVQPGEPGNAGATYFAGIILHWLE